MHYYTAFRRQRCSVCNVCKTALPGLHAVPENTTTSRQCCRIYTGYRFVCARHTKCLFLFVYSVMHDQPPCYLAELLSHRQPNRRLRSASLPLLTLPASQTVTHGDRHFAVAAAALWNGLDCRTVLGRQKHSHIIKHF